MIATILAATVLTWTNPECATGNCELKAMRLHIDKMNDNNYKMAGNNIVAELETTSKEHLSKYAFVQYIQGCLYETSNLGETKLAVREFFGKQGQPFKHVGWEIDSAGDKDPIYWSNPDAGYDELRGFEIPRNSSYINDNSMKTENYLTWAGKISNLRGNKIFADDMPTPSAWAQENGIVSARNSALKFKICVHKISDVPESVEDPKTQIEGALGCLEWSSNYQFNFKKKVFEEKTTIPAVCK